MADKVKTAKSLFRNQEDPEEACPSITKSRKNCFLNGVDETNRLRECLVDALD